MIVSLLAALLIQDPKAALPEAEAQKEAEKMIRDLFKDEYAKRAPADRRSLAAKLLKQAPQSTDSPAAHFVLLREARDIASQAGDLTTAWQAVDGMSQRFAVEPLPMKLASLSALAEAVKTSEDAKTLAVSALELTDLAVTADDYATAEKSTALAVTLSRKAKEVALSGQATGRGKEVVDLKGKHEKVKKAFESISANPGDAAAAATVGQFQCFTKGQWDVGLPLLAKGNDAGLADLASQDLANPPEGSKQAALGDAWRALAERQKAPAKGVILQRARHWYGKAAPTLTGLQKAKLENALGEIEKTLPRLPPIPLFSLIDPKKDSPQGGWSLAGLTLATASTGSDPLTFPYDPPDDYDLKLTVERKSGPSALIVGIAVGGTQASILLDGWETFDRGGLSLIDGKLTTENGTAFGGKVFLEGKPVALICSVRRTGVKVVADGKVLIDWKGIPEQLSVPSAQTVPVRNVPYLISLASFSISEMTLTPIGEPGRRLR